VNLKENNAIFLQLKNPILKSQKIVHCAHFSQVRQVLTKKIPQKKLKRASKIEHNEALILFYIHYSLLSSYYQVRKPPPRLCHSFTEKKNREKMLDEIRKQKKNFGNGKSF